MYCCVKYVIIVLVGMYLLKYNFQLILDTETEKNHLLLTDKHYINHLNKYHLTSRIQTYLVK